MKIEQIDVAIKTGKAETKESAPFTNKKEGPGTNGWVYLGLSGREFHVDTADNNLEAGALDEFTLGEFSNILQSYYNDPRNPWPRNTEDLAKYPAYIRFEPRGEDDKWLLDEVIVTVNPNTPSEWVFSALIGRACLWMGQTCGKVCFLEATKVGEG